MAKIEPSSRSLTLHPLKYQEAVGKLLKVKPEPKEPKGKRNGKTHRNASR